MRGKIRVLIAKVGLDGHDRGAKVVSRMLMDAGMEVVYLGKLLTAQEVVQAAQDEDVDVLGLSFLSGEHLAHSRHVLTVARRMGLKGVVYLVGGCIPREDIPRLKKMGVHGVFIAGTPIRDIVDFIKKKVKKA